MQQYRFMVFDEHKLITESRDFWATDDETAVVLADGWRDACGGQVWSGSKLLKHWPRGTRLPSASAPRTAVRP